ncbi:hypothetical protein D3C86_1555420 [compost metagenome]
MRVAHADDIEQQRHSQNRPAAAEHRQQQGDDAAAESGQKKLNRLHDLRLASCSGSRA